MKLNMCKTLFMEQYYNLMLLLAEYSLVTPCQSQNEKEKLFVQQAGNNKTTSICNQNVTNRKSSSEYLSDETISQLGAQFYTRHYYYFRHFFPCCFNGTISQCLV